MIVFHKHKICMIIMPTILSCDAVAIGYFKIKGISKE